MGPVADSEGETRTNVQTFGLSHQCGVRSLDGSAGQGFVAFIAAVWAGVREASVGGCHNRSGHVVCPPPGSTEHGGVESGIRNDIFLRHSRGARMTRFSFSRTAAAVAVAIGALSSPARTEAQGYFGRQSDFGH